MNPFPLMEPFPANTNVLRMRGLPYSVTEDEVRAFFQGYDLDGDDSVVIISQGFHRGEGFVRFQTADGCAAAHQKLNRQCIGQRYIELYASTEGAMQLAQQQLKAMGEQKNFIVRLRGLPFQATEHNIEEFFADILTSIANIQLCCGMDGRLSGDAFVELTTPDALSKALEKNRNMLGHRYIEVFVSNVHERDVLIMSARRGGRMQRGAGQMGMWGRGGRGGAQNYGPYTSSMMQTNFVPFQRPTSSCVVRIRGLPFDTTETQIAELLGDVNIPSQGVHLVYNAQERPTGEAFVEVLSEQDITAALRHNGEIIGKRYIEVFRSSPMDMSRLSGGAATAMDPYAQAFPGIAAPAAFAQPGFPAGPQGAYFPGPQGFVQQPSMYSAQVPLMPPQAAFQMPGFTPAAFGIPATALQMAQRGAPMGYSWAGDLPTQFQQTAPPQQAPPQMQPASLQPASQSDGAQVQTVAAQGVIVPATEDPTQSAGPPLPAGGLTPPP